jgi:beta-1,4-mannosyltransferase
MMHEGVRVQALKRGFSSLGEAPIPSRYPTTRAIGHLIFGDIVSPSTSESSLAVLQSAPRPRPTTNPYIVQLFRSLESVPGVTVHPFSWRFALFGKYDVFHVHWPENLLQGHSRAKSFARHLLTRALLFRLSRSRIPIVRTMHNLEQPAGLYSAAYDLLNTIEERTSLVIRLNEQTPILRNVAVETIRHGHYRDWFESFPRSSVIAGRLGFVGMVRRYKNVPHLVRVATALPSQFSLRVSGDPSSPDLAREIEDAAGDDARIFLSLRFLADAELVSAVTEAELIVLPYTEMHNSGSVIASLSLDRPVLVRDNDVNRALAAEVGDGWFYYYEGDLQPEDAEQAHASLRLRPPTGPPDLRLLDWAGIGTQHVDAYRRALALVGV